MSREEARLLERESLLEEEEAQNAKETSRVWRRALGAWGLVAVLTGLAAAAASTQVVTPQRATEERAIEAASPSTPAARTPEVAEAAAATIQIPAPRAPPLENTKTEEEMASDVVPPPRPQQLASTWMERHGPAYQQKCLGDGVCVVASNDYERRLARPIANGVFDGILLEMFEPATLDIVSDEVVGCRIWRDKPDSRLEMDAVDLSGGCSTSLTPRAAGVYSLLLELKKSPSPSSSSSSSSRLDKEENVPVVSKSVEVTCKYVRRELRDLREGSIRAYLDAMTLIYHVGQREGVAKYGTKFRSAAWLVREHLYGGAQKECDHWHDDAGFVNHHVGITMQLEQSLQAIDKTTAAHYWDYTIDSARLDQWTESNIFGDAWFGTVKPGNDKHVVDEGRWAYTPIMKDATSWSNITNPYGLLRSPWNTNPTPYITRMNYIYGVKDGNFSLPQCELFLCVFAWAEDMGVINSYLNGVLHGPIHIMSGGLWAVDMDLVDDSKNLAQKHAMNDFLLASKFMWRQGMIKCPTWCSLDTPAEDCLCALNPALGDVDPKYLLNISGILDLFVEVTDIRESNDLDWKQVLRILAHFGHAGEMYTSAAPYDPLFWPLHGMAERYVQAIRYYIAHGESNVSEAWSYYHPFDVVSDTRVVCDWSNVDEWSLEMPDCVFGETCPGHKIDDLLPFESIFVNTEKSYLTNRDFYAMTSPFSEHITYVYDQLTNWTECGNLLEAAKANKHDKFCSFMSSDAMTE
ncbi:hypothetical protein CTAYLR_001414 [Chrysophaeum taylorii]|uniref:Tyrosinase copper-binding domain-containing protein n=1 Tax=Chrysophaeum taylorii TaxID=2483200 RepID=A0AAD7U991_9STRA|nr:hypothetical protein CTAYLR_001414 [Chrysophaeum taylorii]